MLLLLHKKTTPLIVALVSVNVVLDFFTSNKLHLLLQMIAAPILAKLPLNVITEFPLIVILFFENTAPPLRALLPLKNTMQFCSNDIIA